MAVVKFPDTHDNLFRRLRQVRDPDEQCRQIRQFLDLDNIDRLLKRIDDELEKRNEQESS